jgi:hypothetical protein
MGDCFRSKADLARGSAMMPGETMQTGWTYWRAGIASLLDESGGIEQIFDGRSMHNRRRNRIHGSSSWGSVIADKVAIVAAIVDHMPRVS